MNKKYEIGRFGEGKAVKYLKRKGYKILERNFFSRYGEIDIIALDKKEIVFIEIKSRTNSLYGNPAEAVTNNKLNHIYNTAKYYLYIHNLLNKPVRIDVIEIYIKNKKININHLKQVV